MADSAPPPKAVEEAARLMYERDVGPEYAAAFPWPAIAEYERYIDRVRAALPALRAGFAQEAARECEECARPTLERWPDPESGEESVLCGRCAIERLVKEGSLLRACRLGANVKERHTLPDILEAVDTMLREDDYSPKGAAQWLADWFGGGDA